MAAAEARNMRLLSTHDLGGFGNGGEGIALQVAGERRVLYIAHESGPKDFTAIDVTDPEEPSIVIQIPGCGILSSMPCVNSGTMRNTSMPKAKFWV